MKNNDKQQTTNNKRKILIINTTYKRGGAAQIARTLYNGLKNSLDITPYFYFGRGKRSEDRNVFKTYYLFEFFIHLLFVRFLGLEGLGSFFSTRALKVFIKKRKFDLIHIHNIHGYYLNFSFMKFVDTLNIPIVWTFHDVWPVTGRCAYFSDCKKWQDRCSDCEYKLNYPITYIDRSSYLFKKKKKIFSKLNNLTIVTPSTWLQNIVNKSFLKSKKNKNIANGVDTQLFRVLDKKNVREDLDIPLGSDCILYIASDIDDERKGFGYFLKSLSMLDRRNLKIITVGKISEKTKNLMDNFDCIHFGKVKHKEFLVSIYNAADIYVISSIDDNFPNTVLESLACGVPVIGFKTGGIPDQVDESCGILVEQGDSTSLASSINDLLNDKIRLNIMSKQCRLRCESFFALDIMIENYGKLYEDSLNQVPAKWED